jgi:hypothetical protein
MLVSGSTGIVGAGGDRRGRSASRGRNSTMGVDVGQDQTDSGGPTNIEGYRYGAGFGWNNEVARGRRR